MWEGRFFFIFTFSLPHLGHRDVPRLGAESELHLPAYTTATAMPDLSRICDLSFLQRWILHPLSKARERTRILMDTSQALNLLSRTGNADPMVLTYLFPSLSGSSSPNYILRWQLEGSR